VRAAIVAAALMAAILATAAALTAVYALGVCEREARIYRQALEAESLEHARK
jgi:hypothetical protein